MNDLGQILMVIPARGGSKRLPRKNILPLNGKPLICWTIDAALETSVNARILVSSDDDEILGVAQQYEHKGVIAHRRSRDLATDNASTVDVLVDAIEAEKKRGVKPGIIVLLQPTSPLRSSADILAALELFDKGEGRETVVSVCEVDHPTAWVDTIDDKSRFDGGDFSGKRSQEYQKEYRLNGAVYVASVDILLKRRSIFTEVVKASVMRRDQSIDIDDVVDYRVCEFFMGREQ